MLPHPMFHSAAVYILLQVVSPNPSSDVGRC